MTELRDKVRAKYYVWVRSRRGSGMRDAEFSDPRLVEIYDAECPWSAADDYFVVLMSETPGARALDLECGTGPLAWPQRGMASLEVYGAWKREPIGLGDGELLVVARGSRSYRAVWTQQPQVREERIPNALDVPFT